MDKEIQWLHSQIKALREQMGALAAKKAAEEQLEPPRQQLVLLEGQLRLRNGDVVVILTTTYH